MNSSPLVANFGGGVNSVAMLIFLWQKQQIPTAIVMSDPGHEWPESIQYREEIMQPWLAAHDMPPVVVVSRESEAAYNPASQWKGTLGDDCMRKGLLPSAAFGMKSCSLKFKAEPAQWWVKRQAWAQTAWARGERIQRAIGYDADESRRVKREFGNFLEAKKYVPVYPLFDAGIDRESCAKLIVEAGLPVPRKSACTFCPNNTAQDWADLRSQHPEQYAYAVEMSRNSVARVESPEVVGLMRCNPHGKRQLHVFHDGGYSDSRECDTDMPCECAL